MKYTIKLFLFTMLSAIILCDAKAEETYATVHISGNSFNDATDSWFGGGANVKVVSLSFYISEQFIGTISRQNLTTPDSYDLTALVNISEASPSLKIIVRYSHHEWNAFGTTHYYPNLESTFDLTTVTLGRYASETRTFNQFTDLDETILVDWRFNYYITITPFQPAINGSHNICYHDYDNINLTSNNLVFYDNSYASYQWQYGYLSKQWTANPEFTSFKYSIIGSLYSLCPGGDVSCEKIEGAILNTDYSFMNDYYNLYSDLTVGNKYQLASLLLNGILSQQYYYLTNPESTFLSANFRSVCLEQTSWAPPNYPIDVINSWIDITTNDMTGSITFNPASMFPVSTDIVKVGVQVRASCSGAYGPFSDIKIITIKPKAPVFSVSAEPSCKEKETGIIKFANVSGAVTSYKAIVRDKEYNGTGSPEFFYGSDYIFMQKLLPGDYNIDVYYNATGIDGCSVSQSLHVGQEKELSFDIAGTDATCPEKADGQIKVNITQYADYNKDPSFCSINLGVTSYNNTTATFKYLDNQSYNINISDFCTSASRSVVIGEQNVVNVSFISSLDPACRSTPDGSLTAVASGSNHAYDFELYEGSNLIKTVYVSGSTSTFGTLPGGTYTVKSRSDLCTAFLTSDQRSLAPVQELDFTTAVTDVNCFGASTGEIKLTATGGKPGYHYQLGSNPYTDNSEFNSLPSGTYQVTVHTSNMSCNDFKTRNITINSASKIQIGIEAINASCFEKDDGSIKAIVTGGSGVYSYSWYEYTGGAWYLKPGNSNLLTTLYAGRYKINVTDSNNCPMSSEGALSEPPLLVVQSAIPKDVVCYGEKGSITVTASGGSGSYEYSCHEKAGQVIKSSVARMDIPSGNYYVTVKDAHGCEAVFDDYSDIKITAPVSPLDFTFSAPDYQGFNLKCNGDNSGSVNIIALGGNGSGYQGYKYSLSGSPENPTGSFAGLPSGTFTMKVTDSRGCIVQKTLNLTEPPQLNLTLVSAVPVKCYGEPTGEIRVSATGGISDTYKYFVDGTEMLSPGIFNNLFANTYEVEVSDINGCTQSLYATVQSLNPPIGIVMIPEDVRCYGENNGKINTIVSGGSGGFSYSWEINHGSGWQLFGSVSGNLTDLVPAKYRIKAVDSESCYDYRESEIKEPSRMIVSSALPKDVVCFGGKGSMSISASGGTPEYTYYCHEKSGNVYDSPLAELQLPAGVFNISVKDGKGCQVNYPGDIVITAPSVSLDFRATLSSYNGFNVSCSGKNDGFFIAEASGGNGSVYSGYKYSVNGSPDATENSFSNLAKGSYLVRVTDARGCRVEKLVNLNEPQLLSLNLLYSNPVKCFGEATGEFSVGASGGIENTYKYKLNGIDESLSGSFKNLYPGIYKVDVTDINGCSKSLQTTVINKNTRILTQLTSTEVRCKGENNGTITSLVSGGAGGYSYIWEKKSGISWQSIPMASPSARNLSGGFYRLKLSDSDNCQAYDSIAVNEPSILKFSKVSINDAICFGDNGSFEIEAEGGNGGYSFYTTENEGITYNPYNSGDLLAPAVYRIKVRDSKGCELIEPESHYITRPDNPLDFNYELSKFGDYNISCHGNNDGSVILVPSGGNGYGYTGYIFRLNGIDVNTANFIKNLEAGTYEASLVDGRGCRITKTILLSEPVSEMNLKIASIEYPRCVYDKNGSVSLFAEGGNQPYEYSVNESFYGSSSVFSNLPVAQYTFKVRDASGCSEVIDTSLVNLVSEMEVTGMVADVKCYGESSGTINVEVKGGASPYTFRWKDNSTVSPARSLLSKGEYTVSITDGAGCTGEKSFTISEPERRLSVSAISTPACAELKNGIVTATAEGGTPPYQFAIDRRTGFNSNSGFDVFSGNHNVFVSDINNCLSEASVVVGVKNVKPDINFMLATSRYELDTLVIIDVSVPVPDKVVWGFPEGTIIIDTTSHKAMIKYTQAGLYPVKMRGRFGECVYEIDKLLNISPFDPLVSNEDRNREGIKSLVVSPNPNEGRFIINLDLYSKQEVAVKIFDFNSRIMFSEKWPADISFRKEINLTENALPGNYVLWIIGENDSRPLIFVISK